MAGDEMRVNGAQIELDFAGHRDDSGIYSESARKPPVNTKHWYGMIFMF